MTDKLPVTTEMSRYIELDAQEKAIKAEKEQLREAVLSQFAQGYSYEDMSCTVRDKIDIKKKEFFQWVLSKWPQLINELRIDEIDIEKFDRMYEAKIIDYEDIPEYVYNHSLVKVITIAANKRGAKAPA